MYSACIVLTFKSMDGQNPIMQHWLKWSLVGSTFMKDNDSNNPRAKKVVSDSPGLVDSAIGLVNSVFNLPNGQVMFFEEEELKSILLIKKLLGLVEMTSWLDFLYTPNNIIITRVFSVNEIKKVTFVLWHSLALCGIKRNFWCLCNCTKQKHAKLPYVCANNYY